MTVTFGYEFEVAGNGAAVLDALHGMGAVANDYLCPYHGCGCSCCDHTDTEYLFSAQEDETVSAEFPSRVLEWGSDRAEEAFQVMQRAAVSAGADLSGDSGMHVHVAKPGALRTDVTEAYYVDPDPAIAEDGRVRAGRWCHNAPIAFSERELATWRLLRLFVRYQEELRDIAAGHRDEVRGYNSPVREYHVEHRHPDAVAFWSVDLDNDPPPLGVGPYSGERGRITDPSRWLYGSWLDVNRHTHTYEFRLWNATKAAWRQRLCVALSVAMVEAATAGVDVTEHDPRPVEEVLAPWLDDQTWAGILRQRYFQGGIQ